VLAVVGGLLAVTALVAAFAPYGPWPTDSQSYCGAIFNPPASSNPGPWCDSYRTDRWILVLLLAGLGAVGITIAVTLRRESAALARRAAVERSRV
jgi:hypothetical protein